MNQKACRLYQTFSFLFGKIVTIPHPVADPGIPGVGVGGGRGQPQCWGVNLLF